jgi:hypothetical protein
LGLRQRRYRFPSKTVLKIHHINFGAIIMKKLLIVCVIAGFGFYFFGNSSSQASASPKARKSAFILVMDDSGVLTEPERARQQKLMMLAQLKALYTRKQFAQASLNLISTSYGRSVWVGSIADLRSERANEVLTKIEADPKRCNQLEAAFKSVKSSIAQLEQRGANDIHVYVFSSMIATPNPCNDLKISLPQLPIPVNFEEIFTSSEAVSSVGIYFVNAHQLRLYQAAFEPVALWANTNSKEFGMFDVEDTDYQLRQRLLGVSK